MNELKFGYSKLKVSLALLMMGYLGIFPLLIPLLLPGIYSVADKSTGDVLILGGTLAVMSVVGFCISALIIKKLSSTRYGIILNDQGVLSNVSGLTERFFRWDEVIEAVKVNNVKGPDLVRLMATTDKPATAFNPAGTVLWHLVLDVSGKELIEAISTYKEQINANTKQSIVKNNTLQEHMNKAA